MLTGVRTNIICDTCKARKKGCDLQKPSCGRCSRLGIACYYRARSFLFVAAEPDSANSLAKDGLGTASGVISSRSKRSALAEIPRLSSDVLLKTDSDLQVTAAFWHILFPRDHPDSACGILSAGKVPWLMAVQSLNERQSYLKHAILALAFTALGWWRSNTSLKQRGRKEYILALRRVNEALQDPIQARDDFTLACCRLLSLFEMFGRMPSAEVEQSQRVAYLQHVEGTYELIYLRGDECHLSGVGYSLYDGVRMTAIIQAISQRKPNKFTRLCSVPADKDSLRDVLFELARNIPELLEASDNLRTQVADHPRAGPDSVTLMQKATELLESFTTTGRELLSWLSSALQLSMGVQSQGVVDDDSAIDLEESLFSICKAQGRGFFYICTQYWAICIHTYSAAYMTQRALSQLQDQHTGHQILPAWMSPERPATYLAATAAHFFEDDAGLWGAQSAMFPLGVVLSYYIHTGRRESPQTQTIFNAVGNSRAGVMVRDFLVSLTEAR